MEATDAKQGKVFSRCSSYLSRRGSRGRGPSAAAAVGGQVGLPVAPVG